MELSGLKPQRLFPEQNCSQYPLPRVLDVSQSSFGHFGEDKSFATADKQALDLLPSIRNKTVLLGDLSRLQ